MSSDQIIDELKSISGVVDFGSLSKEDAARLLALIGEQKLSEAHIKALVEIAPAFLGFSSECLKAMSNVADGAKITQTEAISTIKKSISGLTDVLGRLAENAESDETREKIAFLLLEAGKLYVEMAKILKDMNKDNNDTWIKIAGILGTVLTVVITVVFGGGAGKGGNNKA